MTRIFIDTDELRDIARDLRNSTGELNDLLGEVGSGFHTTWMPLGVEMAVRWEGQSVQLRVLEARVMGGSVSLDIEALERDAEEVIDDAVSAFMGGIPWVLHELDQGIDWTTHEIGHELAELGHFADKVVVDLVVTIVVVAIRVIVHESGPWIFLIDRLIRHQDYPMRIQEPPGADQTALPAGAKSWEQWEHDLLEHAHTYADYMRIIGAMPPGTILVVQVADTCPARWVVLMRGIDMMHAGTSKNSLKVAAEGELVGWGPYEAAINAAMVKAGVQPGDHLMLMGHSQGGITARNLAADHDFTHRYVVDGVLTAGAPVSDGYPLVDSRTKAVELYNVGDPVTLLNTRSPFQDFANRGQHTATTFNSNFGDAWDPTKFHGNENYARELEKLSASNGRGSAAMLHDPTLESYLGPPAPHGVHVVGATAY